MALGRRALPLMLEVQTCDDRLTTQTVQDLGFELTDPRVVNWKLGRIFDYYSRQNLYVE